MDEKTVWNWAPANITQGSRQTPWVYQDAKGDWHLTHGQRAQPYLKPAVTDHVGQYRSIIETELIKE